MRIRRAVFSDIDAVSGIYERIHSAEERGLLSIGWQRGVYPERETALAAIERADLFVCEDGGRIVGSAILNQQQVDVYALAPWKYPCPEVEVMVMHTLAIAPEEIRKGYGRAFAGYYEEYALENGCRYLRIDTNERNTAARAFYSTLGYSEIAVIPCTFNGISGVGLVLLEKRL